jgi:hypothetical protein
MTVFASFSAARVCGVETTMGVLAWLARVLNIAPLSEMKAMDLADLRWQIDGGHLHPSEFLRALPTLLPEDCFLWFERAEGAAAIDQFFARQSVPAVAQISRATIWPRMAVPNVPAVPAVIYELADLAESYSAHDLCYHLHVYDRQGVLLFWHDAFADPFRISQRLPRERIEAFCRELHVSYEPC